MYCPPAPSCQVPVANALNSQWDGKGLDLDVLCKTHLSDLDFVSLLYYERHNLRNFVLV